MNEFPAIPHEVRLAVMGLGYVGLPLSVEFAKKLDVVAFDVDEERIAELKCGHDHTQEVNRSELAAATRLKFTNDLEDLRAVNVYVVTTPTPVDAAKQPDMSAVVEATLAIARSLSPGDVVIYESTVYPGATEELCVPILQEHSGLVLNEDFAVGYSPERANPGDPLHRISGIVKVTSGSSESAAQFVDDLYSMIVRAGTFRAASIRVAEASKLVENVQRDVNIALINELAILFNKLGIDTEEVLSAAASKWNFVNLRPGLVGGHCIGVDPYYLTYKAQQVGHHPEVIGAGRRLNDAMGAYVSTQLIKRLTREGIQIRGSRALVLGLTFKEDTPDLRNSGVTNIVHELRAYGMDVDVHDPWADAQEARLHHGVELTVHPETGSYDAIIIAVAHRQFREMGAASIRSLGKKRHVLYDLKYVLSKGESDLRL